MDYADNVILVCNGPEEMQRLLDCLVSEGRKASLVINSRKSEIINMNIKKNAQNCSIEGSVIK